MIIDNSRNFRSAPLPQGRVPAGKGSCPATPPHHPAGPTHTAFGEPITTYQQDQEWIKRNLPQLAPAPTYTGGGYQITTYQQQQEWMNKNFPPPTSSQQPPSLTPVGTISPRPGSAWAAANRNIR